MKLKILNMAVFMLLIIYLQALIHRLFVKFSLLNFTENFE